MLTVTNNNDFEFTGRYDGCDYHFPVGKTTAITDQAAQHIFGIGLTDKVPVLVRYGWMLTGNQYDSAIKKLNKFSFNVAEQLQAGEIIDTVLEPEAIEEPEQGSAPLLTEGGGEGDVPDGAKPEPSQPATNGRAKKKSILDELNAVGAE